MKREGKRGRGEKEGNTVNMSLSRGCISKDLRGRVHRHLGKSTVHRGRMGRAWSGDWHRESGLGRE